SVDPALRRLHHQVRLERKLGHAAHRLEDRRTHGQVGHEVAVHDVDLDPVGAAGLRLRHLVAQPEEVGRKDRGDDLDAPAHAAAAWSTSHSASGISPAGTWPAWARRSASAFSAPVTKKITRRALRRQPRVSETRSGGGLGAPWTATAQPAASSAGLPGNSDAVCPSSPRPSSTRSSGWRRPTSASYH